MILSEQTLFFGHELLLLNNQKSIFWKRESMLLLSDLHIGKSAHFRKHGLAIPHGVLENDLERLQFLISHYQPKKVVFVGDLFHHQSNSEFEIFAQWLDLFPEVTFILITGNHDRHSKKYNFPIQKIPFLAIGNILLHHEPLTTENYAVISGHIHPGVSLQMPNRQKLKLPCFLVSEKQLILPAFSDFTGLDTKFNQDKRMKSFVITNEHLIEITP